MSPNTEKRWNTWCSGAELTTYINVNKTKEMVVDLGGAAPSLSAHWRNSGGSGLQLQLPGCAHNIHDLTWSACTSWLAKKCLYFLRKLQRAGLGSSILKSFYHWSWATLCLWPPTPPRPSIQIALLAWLLQNTVFNRNLHMWWCSAPEQTGQRMDTPKVLHGGRVGRCRGFSAPVDFFSLSASRRSPAWLLAPRWCGRSELLVAYTLMYVCDLIMLFLT